MLEDQIHYDPRNGKEFKIWFFKNDYMPKGTLYDDPNINMSEIEFQLYGVQISGMNNQLQGNDCQMIYSDWAPSTIKKLRINFDETLAENSLHDIILRITVKPQPRLGDNQTRRFGKKNSLDLQNEIEKIKPFSTLETM